MKCLSALVATSCLLNVPVSVAQAPPAVGTHATTVATIGDVSLTEDSFRTVVGSRLRALESQVYYAKRQLLDDMIADKLLEIAARDVGQPVAEYTRRELAKRTKPVTDEEVKAIYESGKNHLDGGGDLSVLGTIRSSLEQSRATLARKGLVRELRKRYKVRVLLTPPRIEVPQSDAPARGPAVAPVRMVVFSDFQCPFCAQLASTLGSVKNRFGDQIRVEYRHFPLPMHKDATLAAQAAACMADQGYFWEMHDTLYANPKRLGREDLLGYAETVRGDSKALRDCLDSGAKSTRVSEDKRVGEGLGVTATPATFINGWLLPGAVPLQELLDIIEEELERARSGDSQATRGNR